MSKNIILDYEQVVDRLDSLCKKYYIIKKQDDLAVSRYGLPISYYTVGNGSKDIVITGATHGAELVTCDFVLRLMEEMGRNPNDFNLNEYTYHILPLLNPEGYLITSSAVRTKIPRDMELDDAEKICRDYYLAYRRDDQEAIARKKEGLEPDRVNLKNYQRMFSDVDYSCISQKYSNIGDSVKKIYERYPDLPKGSIVTWDANADGIDIQANMLSESLINKMFNGMHSYGVNRYNNIDCSHPGPMNCGMDREVGFYETIETKAISGLLEKLNNRGTLVGYNNYHSTGGVVYHRPSRSGNGVHIDNDLYWQKIVNNVCLAYSYKYGTYKNIDDIDNSKYGLVNGVQSGVATTTNDVFRMKYPADLLIELSGMGGNPIAPYGDIKGNYTNLMTSNIQAFKSYVKNYKIVKKLADYLYKSIEPMVVDKQLEDEELVNDVVKLVYEKAEDMMVEVNRLLQEDKIEDVYVKDRVGVRR